MRHGSAEARMRVLHAQYNRWGIVLRAPRLNSDASGIAGSGPTAHVAPGRAFDHRVPFAAQLGWSCDLRTALPGDPLGPVFPPGTGLECGVVFPLLWIGRVGVVGPVLGLWPGRVDDSGDVPRRAQHEPVGTPEQLGCLVPRDPRDDVIVYSGQHVGVDVD